MERIVRVYGIREIASGMCCLFVEKDVGLQSPVAGDALDIATLLAGLRDDNPKKNNVGLALLMVGGVTLLGLLGQRATAARHARDRGKRRLYPDRSGFPKGIQALKGAAKEFQAPRDMRASPSPAFRGGQ
jgi:hypothetical protein